MEIFFILRNVLVVVYQSIIIYLNFPMSYLPNTYVYTINYFFPKTLHVLYYCYLITLIVDTCYSTRIIIMLILCFFFFFLSTS